MWASVAAGARGPRVRRARAAREARDVRRHGAAGRQGGAARRRDAAFAVRRARAPPVRQRHEVRPRDQPRCGASCSITRRACTRATSRRAASRARRPRSRGSSRTCRGARFGAVAFAGRADEPSRSRATARRSPSSSASSTRTTCPWAARRPPWRSRRARELFARDPKSKDHVRVIVLVTDGEDLEGDPVSVAQNCASEQDADRRRADRRTRPGGHPGGGARRQGDGIRRDDEGKPLTTELSAEGEAQLARVAPGHRRHHRPRRARRHRHRPDRAGAQEDDARGAEREGREVYAEEYAWPLGPRLAAAARRGADRRGAAAGPRVRAAAKLKSRFARGAATPRPSPSARGARREEGRGMCRAA